MRFILGAIFFPLILGCLVLSASNLGQSILLIDPNMAMKTWGCYGKVTDSKQYSYNQELLDRAFNLSLYNGTTLFATSAAMNEWRSSMYSPWSVDAMKARTLSIYATRQITRMRPTWATGWSNLFVAKVFHYQFDDEMYNALYNALEYGKWQRDVQKRVIWTSVGIWKTIPDDLKQDVRDSFKRLLSTEFKTEELALLAIRYNWYDELIPLLSNPEQIALLNKLRNSPEERNRLWQTTAKMNVEQCLRSLS